MTRKRNTINVGIRYDQYLKLKRVLKWGKSMNKLVQKAVDDMFEAREK